jgi:hypothetical protein
MVIGVHRRIGAPPAAEQLVGAEEVEDAVEGPLRVGVVRPRREVGDGVDGDEVRRDAALADEGEEEAGVVRVEELVDLMLTGRVAVEVLEVY